MWHSSESCWVTSVQDTHKATISSIPSTLWIDIYFMLYFCHPIQKSRGEKNGEIMEGSTERRRAGERAGERELNRIEEYG